MRPGDIKLVSNDVYRIPMPGAPPARIRVQCDSAGDATFRVQPFKGEADEPVAMAAIQLLKEWLESHGYFYVTACRRYRVYEEGEVKRVDVVDSILAAGWAEKPEELLEKIRESAHTTVAHLTVH